MFVITLIMSGCMLESRTDESQQTSLDGDDVEVEDVPYVATYSLFSWDKEAVLPEERARLLETLDKYEITTIYQWFTDSLTDEEVQSFVQELNENGVEVYLLTGDPSWIDQDNLKDLFDAIDRAASFEEIKGVVIDVEPQQHDLFDEDEDAALEDYTDNMNAAYRYAKALGLEVIQCVPATWDEHSALKTLIAECSDTVAVMNYFRGDEADMIAVEAEIAMSYDKGVINVVELQEAGEHGLRESNTYYARPAEELSGAWDELIDLTEGYPLLSFSYHEYNSLLEWEESRD